jgi:hypothetical protein
MIRILLFFLIAISSVGAQTGDEGDEFLNNLIDEEGFVPRITPEITIPIDINRAEDDDLARIPFLTDKQIRKIENNRPFRTFSELAEIIGRDSVKLIRPFIDLKKAEPIVSVRTISRISRAFPLSQGYFSGSYNGSPFDIYNCAEIHFKSVYSAGILSQKDAGEPDLADHLSGYISARLLQDRFRIVLGNFRASAGTGLVISPPYGQNSGMIHIRNSRESSLNLRPILSAQESPGFYGLSFLIKIPGISALIFYSYALLDPLIDIESGLIYGYKETGLHRTVNESFGRESLRQSTSGICLTFPVLNQPFCESGLILLHTVFNPEIVFDLRSRSESMVRRNFYHFSGNQVDNLSIFLKLRSARTSFDGELALSRPGKYACQFQAGFGTDDLQTGMFLWHLEPDYYSPSGRIAGNSTGFPANTRGVRMGISVFPYSGAIFSISLTLEKSLFRTATVQFPGSRREIVTQLEFPHNRNTKLILRYQHDRISADADRQKVRIHLLKKISQDLRLQSRVEFSTTSNWRAETGFLVFQDFQWQFFTFLRITARISFFHTSSYDLRIYEFENDLPGILRTVPVYGSGNKWYLIIRLDPMAKITLWLKIKQNILDDADSIGSGYDATSGDHREEFRLQIGISY